MTRPFPLHADHATVTAVRRITPTFLRVTLEHPTFADPGIEQPGEIITLGWPIGDEPLVMPATGWRLPPGTPAQHWRNFTVRRFDRGRATIDVDVFLHGGPGRATAWAAAARPGHTVGFAGPRTHWVPAADARWSLLVADETGLPALLAILETLPADHRAIALAEVADGGERQAVQSAADVELRWITRGGRPPGTTTALFDAVRGLTLPGAAGQAWGGGEALAMRDIRRHLAAGCPAVAGSTKILGYWKHRDTPQDAW